MATVSWQVGNETYHFTREQSDEIDAYSESEPSDAKFNAWLKQYAKDKGVAKKSYGKASYWTHVPNAADDITKMTQVKQSAITLMRVVDPTITAKNVAFDQALEPGDIVIPSGPATDAVSLHEAIDSTAGFAIHAAFLNEEKNTRSGYFGPSPQHRVIHEALNTMRANVVGLKDNPGFADYIDSATEYVYNGYQLPAEWNSESVGAQLAVLMAPTMYGNRVGTWDDKPYADKVRRSKQIIDKYVDKEYVNKAEIVKAVDGLYQLLEITDDTKKDETPVPMGFLGADVKGEMSDKAQAEIDARIEMEQETEDVPGIGNQWGSEEPISIIKLKPERENHPTITKPTGSVLKVDARLRLKKTLARNVEPYQRSGDLDEDELYRLLQRDDRVFLNIEEEQEESASIHFLVDISGSMGMGIGHISPKLKVHIAAEMAWLFAHSMNKRPNVNAHVWAHTGDTGLGTDHTYTNIHSGVAIYDVWQSGENLNRLDLLLQLARGNNYDGFAIQYVGKKILAEPAEKRYLIVLSDGYPAGGYAYGGEPAQEHMLGVTNGLLKKGVHVVQIAIGGELRDQGRMFKHFVMFKSVDQTIKDFAKILDKAR